MLAVIDDTIIAVASAPGRSERSILRCSGPSLADLISALFTDPLPPRQLTATRMRLASSPSAFGGGSGRGGPELPVLAVHFPGPHSYTGEDILEIQLPGNPALLERAQQTLLTTAASFGLAMRLAEPGEFTRRAYLAGRIDLTKAEGIAATISAVSDAQLAAAKMLRRGRLGEWANQLTDQLANLLALVEAGIDFVDQEDVVPITPRKLSEGVDDIVTQLENLLASSRTWRQIETLPGVVLVGPPNVGKSSLFNALLGRERAVTSDLAGTTRDVLAEPLQWRDASGRTVEAMLIDIAGLEDPLARPLQRAGSPPIDAAMQQAAHDTIARAELILLLTDTSPAMRVFELGRDKLPAISTLRIGAKSDRITHTDVDVAVSAHTGQGLDELRHMIAARLANRAVALGGELLALQDRHLESLHAARDALHQTQQMIIPQRDAHTLADMELIAGRMRHALDALGAITGQISPDELIGRVFATFCVGK